MIQWHKVNRYSPIKRIQRLIPLFKQPFPDSTSRYYQFIGSMPPQNLNVHSSKENLTESNIVGAPRHPINETSGILYCMVFWNRLRSEVQK